MSTNGISAWRGRDFWNHSGNHIAVVALACALLAPASARAIALNDLATEAAGGIENFWDRENALPGVVSLALPVGNNCTGTLINSRTVLTASHCIVADTNSLQAIVRNNQYTIRFAPDLAAGATEHDRSLSGALAHPDYQAGLVGRGDIALLSLSSPVTGVAPVRVYRPGDPLPEVGSLVTIAGYGFAGTGTEPAALYDNKRRIAQTRIGGGTDGGGVAYLAQFRDPLSPDDPDFADLDALGFPVPYLQGEPGAGDSGGPMFLVTEQGLIQIGTVIGGSDGYGSFNFWTPIPDHVDWLARENPLRDVVSLEGRHFWSDGLGWSGDPPSNVDGNFDGWGRLGRYYNVTIGDRSAVTLDVDPVIDSLRVAGDAARLDITAAHSLTSLLGVAVSTGTVVVDGALIAGAGVHLSGGELHGSGRIDAFGGVFNTGGIVAPGGPDAVGTLTIDGSYRQGAAGSLSVDIIGGEADRLAVSGRADLAGTLALNAHIDRFDPDRRYTLVSAGSGAHGQFTTVTDDGHAFIAPFVSYGAQAVDVRFGRNDVAFASIALTRNAQAAARALENVDRASALFQSVVLTRTEDVGALRRSLDLLTGEAHASAVSVGYGQAQALHGALLGHLRGPLAAPAADAALRPRAFAPAAGGAADRIDPIAAALAPPAPPPRFGFWGTGFGSWGQTRGDGNAATLDTATGGFVIGGEAAPGDNYRLGVAGGYERTTFDIDRRLSSGVGEGVFGALYGSARWGTLSLRAGGAYSFNTTQVRRSVLLPGYRDGASVSYGGNTLSAFGEIGYRIALAGGEIEPFAGASFIRLQTDSFQERGAAAALWGPAGTYDLGTTTLGVRAEASVTDAVPLRVRGLIGWRHAFGDVRPEVLLSLGGIGNAFKVEGVPVGENALVAEAGFDWQPVEALTVGVSISGQIGPKSQTHTLKGNLVWKF
ncbi:autotransporter domain-containing protein [Pseudochelatococcus sp. B33]